MFTDVGFHFKSRFKKVLFSQILVFTLILDLQKIVYTNFFLYNELNMDVHCTLHFTLYCTGNTTLSDTFSRITPN